MVETTPDNENTTADSPASKKAAATLRPLIYRFRIPPIRDNTKQSALQLPFSVLFDNLIAVLWSMYNKETQMRSGINQIQWALEFLKCLKVDYNYPESIGKIVKILEKNMIELYSKINAIQYKAKMQEPSVEILDSKTDIAPDQKTLNEHALYFNEKDIQEKLANIEIRMDRVTGEPRYIKELNALGKRKPKVEVCKNENKSSKTFVIGALKKILKKSTDADTITDVEELIKELNIQNKTPPATGDKTLPATGDKTPPTAGDKTPPTAGDKTSPAPGDKTPAAGETK